MAIKLECCPACRTLVQPLADGPCPACREKHDLWSGRDMRAPPEMCETTLSHGVGSGQVPRRSSKLRPQGRPPEANSSDPDLAAVYEQAARDQVKRSKERRTEDPPAEQARCALGSGLFALAAIGSLSASSSGGTAGVGAFAVSGTIGFVLGVVALSDLHKHPRKTGKIMAWMGVAIGIPGVAIAGVLVLALCGVV